MPHVFDFEKPGNEDIDIDAPSLANFEYLTPQAFGGPKGPVTFSLDAPEVAPKGMLARIFAQRAGPPPVALSPDLRLHILPALQTLGMVRAYCRYDGGNDEGFAWLDHIETKAGERLDVAAVVERLSQGQIPATLLASHDARKDPRWDYPPTTGRDLIKASLDELVCIGDAALLGIGYGTGPFYMYGAFTIDFVTMTVTDDPTALPVVENITIST